MKLNIKNKKVFISLIAFLIVMEGMFLYLSYRAFNSKNKDITLDEVMVLNDGGIELKKGSFAILKETGLGTGEYVEHDSDTWPTDGFIFNGNKSKCYDSNQEELPDVLSFNSVEKVASVTTNQATYCYLYFDKKDAPGAFTFYLGGKENPPATSSTTIPAYLSWTDSSIVQYCITGTNDSATCSWVDSNGTTEVEVSSVTISSGDGTKTMYAFLKDAANNISPSVSDSITLKTAVGGTFTFNIGGSSNPGEITSLKTSLYLAWTDNDVTEYCVVPTNNISLCDSAATGRIKWTSVGTSKSVTPSYEFTGDTEKKELYAFLKDKYGNTKSASDTVNYKKPGSTGGEIVDKPISGVQEPTGVAQDELKTRYYGTNPANYICFGTTNKSTCTGDQDKYMYRIIGIDKSNRFKVIKKEALNTGYRWYSNYTTDIKWPQSEVYSQINGSAFLTNSTYMPSGWADKIETVNWKYGDIYNSDPHTATNVTAAQMVQKEQAWSTTVSAKIGLMYLADYYFGLSKTGTNCSYNSSSTYPTCKTSWMHLSKNDTSAPNNNYEWTMSRYGYHGGNYTAWLVDSGGRVYRNNLGVTVSVRPVFYLKSNIAITGTGTQTDPYMIIN